MGANYSEIQELLQQRADCQARLNLMPYDGNPEIKEQNGSKYLYIRKRIAGKLTSTYVVCIQMSYISCCFVMRRNQEN